MANFVKKWKKYLSETSNEPSSPLAAADLILKATNTADPSNWLPNSRSRAPNNSIPGPMDSPLSPSSISHVQMAEQEALKFNNGSIKEIDPRAWPMIATYWKHIGANWLAKATLEGKAYPNTIPNKNGVIEKTNWWHWSGAFIQYCMQGNPEFQKLNWSGAGKGNHQYYWRAALENTKALKSTGGATLVGNDWIFLTSEEARRIGYKIQVGDIALQRPYPKYHGDIVTSINPVRKVGGNVGNTCRATTGRTRAIVTQNPNAKRLLLQPFGTLSENQTLMEDPSWYGPHGGLYMTNPLMPFAHMIADPARYADNPKDYKKTSEKLFASDWKDWPLEAQIKFCKQNKGKPTISTPPDWSAGGAPGKRIPAPGPTCREILSVNENQTWSMPEPLDIDEGVQGDAIEFAKEYGPAGNNPYLHNVNFVSRDQQTQRNAYGTFHHSPLGDHILGPGDALAGHAGGRPALKVVQKIIKNALGFVSPEKNFGPAALVSKSIGVIRINLHEFKTFSQLIARDLAGPKVYNIIRDAGPADDGVEEREPDLEWLVELATMVKMGSTIVHEVQHNIDFAMEAEWAYEQIELFGLARMRSDLKELPGAERGIPYKNYFDHEWFQGYFREMAKKVMLAATLRLEKKARVAQEKYWSNIFRKRPTTKRESLVLQITKDDYGSGAPDDKSWRAGYAGLKDFTENDEKMIDDLAKGFYNIFVAGPGIENSDFKKKRFEKIQ